MQQQHGVRITSRKPLGHLGEFGRGPLEFLTRCARDHGDLVRLRFLNRPVALLSSPAAIESVLVRHASDFRKNITYRTPLMRRMFGNGVFTSEGAVWEGQRKAVREWLRSERIETYYRLLAEETGKLLAQWEVAPARDLEEDMRRIAARAFGRLLIEDSNPAMHDALVSASIATQEAFARQFSWRGLLGQLLPLEATRRQRQEIGRFHAHLTQSIRNHRGDPSRDFLGHLLASRKDGSGPPPDNAIREELGTLLFAGAETTALVVTWGLHLLARNSDHLRRAQAEVMDQTGVRAPEATDLKRLPFLGNVVREAMRLYPPVWLIGREALAACEVDGMAFRKGETVLMSQWILHRDPRYFPSPGEFEPDRWNAPSMSELPPFAYFPFGGGPRVCPGKPFAELAASLVLALVIRRFHVEAAEGPGIDPRPALTLLPAAGIPAVVTPRLERASRPTH